MHKRSTGEQIAQVVIHLILFAFAVCCIYPFIVTFIVSLSSEKSILFNGYQLIPEQFSTLAYRMVFRNDFIYTGYGVSILVTVVGTALSLFICGMAGYAMSIQRVRYRNWAAMFFYLPMIFNAGTLPWYLVCTQILHLQNTVWALIVPLLVSPFNVFLMRNYFATVPISLVESAEIDGCGVLKTFVQIVLPLSKPIIATVALFIGLMYWNDWSSALWFIDNTHLYPLQYMLYRIKSIMDFVRQNGAMGGTDMPAATFQVATLFVTIGPIILLYPFVQRFFVKGIMVGAVKG
ncbi:carbohydrate ABC transporter permease [Paenibacillus rhizovicinus]|uniref:Carbohydrate ABC transporter permease n=1 Tax=Paenibacillus rhizovicinus TaxID=2704463 RepID=A0A6C0P816_9BACL|nr:carbohydrate ABC transporter permease [Paenibacillus rhizovicinus]QHW33773.1 carbohydrate ABC transporter permease [Paenibacillus rhizovicinus]